MRDTIDVMRLVVVFACAFAFACACACGPRAASSPPAVATASPDQTLTEAMRRVCDAPARARRDRSDASHSDKVAGHLTDGIGNTRVLAAVEAWKTDGIDRAELAALVKESRLPACLLLDEAR
jgi:hypothetical protein